MNVVTTWQPASTRIRVTAAGCVLNTGGRHRVSQIQGEEDGSSVSVRRGVGDASMRPESSFHGLCAGGCGTAPRVLRIGYGHGCSQPAQGNPQAALHHSVESLLPRKPLTVSQGSPNSDILQPWRWSELSQPGVQCKYSLGYIYIWGMKIMGHQTKLKNTNLFFSNLLCCKPFLIG